MFPIHLILHPTDFSDDSGYAFRLACSLARQKGARMIVLHVAVPPMVAYGEALVEIASEESGETLEAKLRHLVRPEDSSVPVEYRAVHQGDPAQETCRVAQESDCGLIVMGTRGGTGLGRLLMGSVTEQVVREAPCPVLTVRTVAPAQTVATIGTILHPTDFSEHAERAFEMACALARDFGARLILLHVAAPLEAVSDAALLPILWQKQAELEEQLHLLAVPHADLDVKHRFERGDAVTEILRVAQEDRADLILMGTHGRTGWGRLLMGSVAEQVVRTAPCPVLTVKMPPSEPRPPSGFRAEESGKDLEDSIRGAFRTPQA